MRYWHPFTEEALAAVSGAEALLAVSLFPHYSIATTGSSLKELARLRARNGDIRPLSVIEHWYATPAYLEALATRIRAAVARLTDEGRQGALILWSAHGLPQKIIDRGDPYVTHIEGTIAGTMALLGDLGLPHRLAYQSRTGPIKWIGPGTEEVIREEASRGRQALVVVPVSFVSDHIETLYEIDLLYGREARDLGIQEYVRMDSFNEGADLTGVLTGLVGEWIGGRGHEHDGSRRPRHRRRHGRAHRGP
jgi:ferrochelatase